MPGISPVAGGVPVTERVYPQYTMLVSWSHDPGASFVKNTYYTATITHEPIEGLTIAISNAVTVDGISTPSDISVSAGVITAAFPATVEGSGWIVRADVTNAYQPTTFSAETSKLYFEFGNDVAGIDESYINITAGTGTLTKGDLTGSGRNWTLAVSDVTTGDISINITLQTP